MTLHATEKRGLVPELIDKDLQYGNQLRRLRTELGMTQEEAAKECGLADPNYWSKLERGTRRPKLELQKRIAEMFRRVQAEASVMPWVPFVTEMVAVDDELRLAGVKMPDRWTRLVEQARANVLAIVVQPPRRK